MVGHTAAVDNQLPGIGPRLGVRQVRATVTECGGVLAIVETRPGARGDRAAVALAAQAVLVIDDELATLRQAQSVAADGPTHIALGVLIAPIAVGPGVLAVQGLGDVVLDIAEHPLGRPDLAGHRAARNVLGFDRPVPPRFGGRRRPDDHGDRRQTVARMLGGEINPPSIRVSLQFDLTDSIGPPPTLGQRHGFDELLIVPKSDDRTPEPRDVVQ